MKAGVVVFPGSNCDSDCWHVLKEIVKVDVQYVWHKDSSLPSLDLVILPGGFSYGDYLRTGAIARFSPIVAAVRKHAESGRAVLGICNGFQVLLECGLLPGAMLRNRTLRFVCKHVFLKTENTKSVFTNRLEQNEVLRIPIAHGEGNYFCDDQTLESLEANNRIAFRYASETGELGDAFNPNGSRAHVAGILNERGNVLGMMPHPERASEQVLGCEDGKKIWESLLSTGQ
jgi:phosphoribosylformylglycinamidine synthase subunit PurQ / glutaminase